MINEKLECESRFCLLVICEIACKEHLRGCDALEVENRP